ncbi:MarR family winged helix-turn-helix transcriptional regulator [Sphingosinicella sp. BN140058]|uniref:MarR family winged helix-turn-helix transcriptional regulator n=1 Tax=Sphingosinicella sp. BN140058 TaxID=1892855 RepID=UPI0010130B0F|nr:MarR family transcriptional regulator [Sphingosinicella sp. BN140058]QAY76383.1 MarR family transcriptional regulator [Sphingosinicella sp. BN140058]
MDINFATEVGDTAHALRRAFDRRAGALGATRAQWRVLAKLARQDGQRQVELAEALEVEPITLSRMVDRLAEAGLVERRADGEDRRVWRIHLTAKAGPLLEKLRALADDFLADALVGISAPEQQAVLETLRRVRANLACTARITDKVA